VLGLTGKHVSASIDPLDDVRIGNERGWVRTHYREDSMIVGLYRDPAGPFDHLEPKLRDLGVEDGLPCGGGVLAARKEQGLQVIGHDLGAPNRKAVGTLSPGSVIVRWGIGEEIVEGPEGHSEGLQSLAFGRAKVREEV